MRNRIKYLDYAFTDVKIAAGAFGQETSLAVSSLGIDTLQADVKCSDPSITDFVQNTPIYYFHRERQMGVFYVQSITRIGPNRYTIYGISAVGLLDQWQHYGGIYTGQTVEEIVTEICRNIPFIIKTNLASTKLYGWLPINTARTNLAQVLFSCGGNLTVDYNGVLRIENLWQGVSSVVPADRVYQGGSVEYAAPVTSVVLLEHQYVPGTDETDLFDGTTIEGQVITFDNPMHSLTAAGFRILESNANYARVSAGSGLLSGKEYIHTTREIVSAVSSAPIENIQRIEDATLVSLVNSSSVVKRLADFYKHSATMKIDHTVQGERSGQVVKLFHPYERKLVDACIGAMDISLSAVLKSETTALIGFTPAKPNAGYYDAVEVITSDTTWVVPEGVTEVRIVLISGGTGGHSGLPGKAAGAQTVQSSSNKYSNMTVYQKYTLLTVSGEGGEPGEGGAGGRIYQATFDVKSGQQFAVKIGAGGAGGAYGAQSNTGSAGEDTTFGAYSSASGSTNPAGFLESVSGVTYGAAGKAGIAGCRGSGLLQSGDSSVTMGPTVTIDGVAYGPGSSTATIRKDEGGSNYNSGKGTTAAYSETGYGGGAAYKANGHPGQTDGSYSAGSSSATSRGGSGGAGADALPPPAAVIPGCGGSGGNGGGGGGIPGRATSSNNNGYSCSGQASLYCYAATPGSGGSGSAGGQAASGCAIVYYSKPKESEYGAFMDRTRRFCVDRTGRLLVI